MIRNEIMTSYQSFSQTFLKFQLLILRWWTVSWVSITEEQRRFKPIINPAGTSRPHDICRSLTYIYQPTLGSSETRTGPRHPRAQHTSNPATFQPRGYTLLPPSLHSQCAGIRLSIGLAEVGLPEYVTSTTKCLVQKIHNEWPLSDIVGNITQHSR